MLESFYGRLQMRVSRLPYALSGKRYCSVLVRLGPPPVYPSAGPEGDPAVEGDGQDVGVK
jgi:hypothetical protein